LVHFGDEDILCSLHFIVSYSQFLFIYFKLRMRVIHYPYDKQSLFLSLDTRERALSDGSHRVDVVFFYAMTEWEAGSKCLAPASLRQLLFRNAHYGSPCHKDCRLQLAIHCIRDSGISYKWWSHLRQTVNVTLGDKCRYFITGVRIMIC
jgi:hypothetical protein